MSTSTPTPATTPAVSSVSVKTDAFAFARAKVKLAKVPKSQVTGTVTGSGDKQALNISVPISELQQAATGERSDRGLALVVVFEHEGAKYKLAGKMSLTAVRS